jgi:hypothetical protein
MATNSTRVSAMALVASASCWVTWINAPLGATPRA